MKRNDIKLTVTPSKELPLKEIQTIGSGIVNMYYPYHYNGYSFSLNINESFGFSGIEYYITNDPEKNLTKLPKEVEVCFIPYRGEDAVCNCNVKYQVTDGKIVEFITDADDMESVRELVEYMIDVFGKFACMEWEKAKYRKNTGTHISGALPILEHEPDKTDNHLDSNNNQMPKGSHIPESDVGNNHSGNSNDNHEKDSINTSRQYHVDSWIRHGYYRADGVYIKSCIYKPANK